ncbi:MAG TPA: diguanylate cyclase [Gaiellaceae bacterium]|nr:diguanylate cyclase [Gaiellaceae bacterium]
MTPRHHHLRSRLREPVLALVASLGAFACLLVLAGGAGRWLELALAAGVAIGARATRRPRLLAVWGAAAGAYLLLEAAFGRAGYERYWLHVAAVVLLGAVVASARAARHRAHAQAAALADARAALETGRWRSELEAELERGRAAEGVERELVRSRRHEHDVSLLLVRLDTAAEVPAAGDEELQRALRAVARAVGRSIRSTDTAAPLDDGGFEVLLPETPPEGARVAAERIRLGMAAEDDGALTVSIGAASFPTDAGDVDELRAAARAALEHAIRSGGNRSVLHTAPPAAPAGWGVHASST